MVELLEKTDYNNASYFKYKMDEPKTRRESKKDQRTKGLGRDGKYGQKHIRNIEALKEKKPK